MKKRRSHPGNPGLKQVACTVSAAALMLGVSPAATVGLHFMDNYCSSAAYSGYPVTVTAFGIAPAGWENLLAMDTGYGCPGLGFTLNQMIDTTTATGGLNPLPNGSLNVTWFGPTANFSAFGAYQSSPPHYNYGGPYPPGGKVTGEGQVYATFLRDGINFGPGSSGGNNNQPGYSVDITGLKTVFTNTPFVIELIASSDSMQTLTNAFIIDAVASTTNSVSYPSTPPVSNIGDAPWVRGQGGGLSTASGVLNTDHIQIMSNVPQHSSSPEFNNAGTISGFIVTDQPVVTMSPQPVLGGVGDTVTLGSYAIGVPPLAYQWRHNGQPLPGANNSTYNVGALTAATAGNYDVVVTNLYGSATSAAAAVMLDQISIGFGGSFVLDSNPANPAQNGKDLGATWQATNSDGTITRTGVMNFNAADPDQITVPGATNFDTTNGTISFWMRSDGAAGGNPPIIFDRHNGSGTSTGNGLFISQNPDGTLTFETPAVTVGLLSGANVADNLWHHVAFVYDQSATGFCEVYIDGALNTSGENGGAWSWPAGQELEFGLSHDTAFWQPYNGLLDDIRFYSRGLTAGEVASVYASDALVDTASLVMRLNFSAAPGTGVVLRWLETDVILQSASSVNGPYVDVPMATSPYSVPPAQSAKFFRYRGHTPVAIASNPYLM